MINANQQISSDAQNLTDALKGDIKLQGTWGKFNLNDFGEFWTHRSMLCWTYKPWNNELGGEEIGTVNT